MTYFIHLEDPGFPDEPWPGVRRLGPYPTSEEAFEQAVSDAAYGMGTALGVYAEAESERRYTGGREGKATHTRAAIAKRAQTLAKQRQKEAADTARQVARDIEATLPPGVGWEDLVEAARVQRERVSEFVRNGPQEPR